VFDTGKFHVHCCAAFRRFPAEKASCSAPSFFMKILGFQLLIGDHLARSVRGLSCAPPM